MRLTCLEHDGYESPELNEKLYLHFRGFRKIENLEPYVNCKALWLESNGFEKIEGLDTLTELRCLYLSKNLLPRIEGLSCLINLTILDLSHNRLTKLENLSCCPKLQTLNVSRNSFTSVESLAHLLECPSVENIDLTHCNIPADETIFENVLTKVTPMMNLAITGNELTKIPSFRKRLIVALPKLHYLDRPIDELERLRSEAYMAAGGAAGTGPEAEKACMEKYRADQKKQREDETATFRAWQIEHRARMQADRAVKVAAREAAIANGEEVPPELQEFAARSSISELTSEEQADYRRAEIQRAQDAEREMLDLGVDKIAAKYWEIEAQDRSKSAEQLMRESVEAVKRDNARRLEEEAQFNNRAQADAEAMAEAEVGVELLSPEPEVSSTEEAPKSSTADIVSPAKPMKTAAELELEKQLEQYRFPVDDVEDDAHTDTADCEDEDTGAAVVVDDEDTPAMQALRQQRVDESLYIFNKQRELKAAQGANKGQGQGKVASTWDVAVASDTVTISSANSAGEADVTPDTLYWTESMDMTLAKFVKSSFFDFALVSSQIIALQKNGRFCEQLNRYCPVDSRGVSGDIKVVERQTVILSELLSGDACRLRWAELDANRWSVPMDGITSGSATLPTDSTGAGITSDVNHKIFVRAADITGAGHGNQPSFEQLSQLASDSVGGSYLKKPMSFPSVRATPATTGGDEDDEDEDLDALD